MIKLYNCDNMAFDTDRRANLIYADCLYLNSDFSWIYKYWDILAANSVMQIQADYHTVAQIKLLTDSLPNSNFISWVIYKQEWGGVPRKGFPMKHDDILIYSNGKDYKWYGDRIQIEKKTAGTNFDKKGTGLKTPCSVFDDLGNFSTIALERIKNPETGKNIQWQKSLKLMRRLMLPFLDNGDLVIDPFAGTGTTGVVAAEIGCDFFGIEYDVVPYNIMENRLVLDKMA